MLENTGNKLYCHIPFIASKTLCLGLSHPKHRTMLLCLSLCLSSANELLPSSSANIYDRPHRPVAICLSIWSRLTPEGTGDQVSESPGFLTCLKAGWPRTLSWLIGQAFPKERLPERLQWGSTLSSMSSESSRDGTGSVDTISVDILSGWVGESPFQHWRN